MNMTGPHRDRFDKADAAFAQACAEVNTSYDVWVGACERLDSIGKERMAAWDNLLEKTIIDPWSADCVDCGEPFASVPNSGDKGRCDLCRSQY